MDERSELERLRGLKRLQELEAKAQAHQQAGPQPFQPADNQDKLRQAQDADLKRQSAIGDTLAPGMGSMLKGAVEQGSLGNIKVPNPGQLPESPTGEAVGRVGAMAAQMIPAGKIMGMMPGAGATVASRLGGSGAIGGIEGLLRAPNEGEDRLGNAASGAGTGLVAGVGGEVLSKAAGAVKGLYNAIRPGSLQEQSQTLKGLLSGKSVDVDPSRLKGVAPDAERMLGASGIEHGLGDVPVSATWANQQRQALDKVSHSPMTGLPMPKSQEEYAAANYLRDKVNHISPDVGRASAELSSNITSKGDLKEAWDMLTQEGRAGKAITKAGVGLSGAAARGAGLGAKPETTQKLDALLSLIANSK